MGEKSKETVLFFEEASMINETSVRSRKKEHANEGGIRDEGVAGTAARVVTER